MKYIDPDGRVVLPITSQFLMQNYPGEIPNGGGNVALHGCAISLTANASYTAGATTTTPDTIRSDSSNFTNSGLLFWANPLPENLSTTGPAGSALTIAQYDSLNAEATEYYVGIKVQYKGTTESPSNSPHWVGVSGTYTDSEGNNYFVISPTSASDSVLGTSDTNNRGGLGWKNVEGVGLVVPVNRVTDYIKYTVGD